MRRFLSSLVWSFVGLFLPRAALCDRCDDFCSCNRRTIDAEVSHEAMMTMAQDNVGMAAPTTIDHPF